MPVEIRELDPHDDAALEAWHAAYFAADSHERPFHAAYRLEEVRARLRTGEPGWSVTSVSALDTDEVVGTGQLMVPTLDNLTTAYVEVGVRPDRRREGIGSLLLDRLEQLARAEGRSRLLVEVSTPYELGAEGGDHPNAAFVRARGFTLGIGDVQRVLDLPVPAERLDRLEAEAATQHHGYTFRDVTGPLPDGLVLPVGRIRAAVETEAPTGDIPKEPEYVDAARVREEERSLAAQGRTRYATLAFAPDGSLAGYTEVIAPEHDPEWIYQWGTLVWGPHRGHSLGLALKVRNTRWVQSLFPDRAAVRTWNAEVNRPMIAVNERMGYRAVERLGEWQKVLGT